MLAAKKISKLLFCVFPAILVWISFPDAPALQRGLFVLTLVALLWLTESLHLTVTALMVPMLCVALGIFDVKQALAEFANPVVFLFLGGFALAAAMHQQGLDRWLAIRITHLAAGNAKRASIYLFSTTALLSMWISNTATAAMMLPLALGMLSDKPYSQAPRNYWYVLLGVAYSANIGGIATVIGSPPNAIAAAQAGLTFFDWLKAGVPFFLLAFPLMIWTLSVLIKPELEFHTARQTEPPLNPGQKRTLLVFATIATLWIAGKPLGDILGIESGSDTLVALFAIFLLTTLKLTHWQEIQRTADWGVLLLFGGGLTLSAMMRATGASSFIANGVAHWADQVPLAVFLLMVVTLIVFLTEFTSNTASSALLIPAFAAVADQLGMSPAVMSCLIAMGASCAFMLPVATPPNAIIYGSGYVPQRVMIKAGIILNLVAISLLTSGGYAVISIISTASH